jgi:purine-cytosine permease-like protein
LSGIATAELPQEFRLPEPHGSLLIGSLLILAGVVIASHTIFGYSLEWLQRWWPAALILVGVYLVVQAIRDRQRKS